MDALQGQDRRLLRVIMPREDLLAGAAEVFGVGRSLRGGYDLVPEAGEGSLVIEPEEGPGTVVQPYRAQPANRGAGDPCRRLGHGEIKQSTEKPRGEDQRRENGSPVDHRGDHLACIEDPMVG